MGSCAGWHLLVWTDGADLGAEDRWIIPGVKSAVLPLKEFKATMNMALEILPWGSHCSSLCVHFFPLSSLAASRQPSQTAPASMATGCRLAGHCSPGGSGIMTCSMQLHSMETLHHQ